MSWTIAEIKSYGQRAESIENALNDIADRVRRKIYDLDWSGEAQAAAASSADRDYTQTKNVAYAYGRLADECVGLHSDIEYPVGQISTLIFALMYDGYSVSEQWDVRTGAGESDDRGRNDELTLQAHARSIATAFDARIPKIRDAAADIGMLAPALACLNMDVSEDEKREISSSKPSDPAAEPPSPGDASKYNVSPAGTALVKSHEGVELEAYQDTGGVWTIGYGHTDGVKPGDQISQAQAETYLQQDLAASEEAVRRLVKVPITQNQFDALVSFTYNVGSGGLENSDVLTRLNAGDNAGAQDAFGKFVYDSKGNKLDGLARRRQDEANLFGTP
ncbi:lysozyme [Nocardia sp. NPDC060259]|uniref:lysozyme n=1 Tax=Nocardia sp. NPDC060259 TaxID=3347088 RepID=UPI0036500FEF